MSAQRRKFPQLTANLQIPREPILTIKRSSVGCNDDGNTPDIRVHDIAVDRDDGKHGVLAGRQPAAQLDPECRAVAGQRDIGEHDSILVVDHHKATLRCGAIAHDGCNQRQRRPHQAIASLESIDDLDLTRERDAVAVPFYPGDIAVPRVCTENLSSGVVVVKSAKDGV